MICLCVNCHLQKSYRLQLSNVLIEKRQRNTFTLWQKISLQMTGFLSFAISFTFSNTYTKFYYLNIIFRSSLAQLSSQALIHFTKLCLNLSLDGRIKIVEVVRKRTVDFSLLNRDLWYSKISLHVSPFCLGKIIFQCFVSYCPKMKYC